MSSLFSEARRGVSERMAAACRFFALCLTGSTCFPAVALLGHLELALPHLELALRQRLLEQRALPPLGLALLQRETEGVECLLELGVPERARLEFIVCIFLDVNSVTPLVAARPCSSCCIIGASGHDRS